MITIIGLSSKKPQIEEKKKFILDELTPQGFNYPDKDGECSEQPN